MAPESLTPATRLNIGEALAAASECVATALVATFENDPHHINRRINACLDHLQRALNQLDQAGY